jgi:hypothetical protein
MAAAKKKKSDEEADHFVDISRSHRTKHEKRNPDKFSPRYKLLQQVIRKHMKRPLSKKHD